MNSNIRVTLQVGKLIQINGLKNKNKVTLQNFITFVRCRFGQYILQP